jgi:hypothetical protein
MGAPGSSSDEKEVEEAEKQEAGLLVCSPYHSLHVRKHRG